jgi:cell wall-associated NlpC family hydrolase
MEWYNNYRLVKDEDGYSVIINLNPDDTEFSKEIMSNLKENILKLDDQIYELVDEKFFNIKVNYVKLMLGSIIVASIPFVGYTKAQAAELNSTSNQQVSVLNTTGVVTASKLNMRTGPSTNYSIMHVLWQGNRVKVIGRTTGWYKIQLSDGRVGWVSATYLRVDLRQQKINTVIYTAKSFLGTPYVWGGESPLEGGFDCSGFSQYVYKQVGYSLNRISADQAKQGTYVSRQNIQPGDLVFYSFEGTSNINHLGIYIGNGQMIHSPKTGDVVKITDITTSYWESRFVTARRIIP